MQITATEAKNRFGFFCSQAKSEPVVVEKDGRPDTVLLSYEEFQALKAAGAQQRNQARSAKAFYERYKDWVDMSNALVEQHGIPGEEFRPW
jgi:prevent-host-death family protein